MQDSTRRLYDAERNFSNKSFRSGCYAPFVSLYFNTLGDVVACCKNQTFVLGNVSKQSLAEIWKGSRIGTLREALADYRFEAGCQFCEWEIQGGNHQGAFPRIFEEFPVHSMTPEWPAVIEFAGSNTCNFECVMCFGELSSSIRAHRDGLPPLAKVYSDGFFEDLRKFLPHLKQAKFLGGEPFLAQECFRIWDMMIADRLSIPCHVTTNASHYNAKVERILKDLPVSLSISIDGATKETVEKVRVNANYEQIIENLHRFLGYSRSRGAYLGLTYCLMRQNWHEFGDFLLFADRLGCPVFVNTVIDPSHCSLYTLSPESLSGVADSLEKQRHMLKGKLSLNRKVWESTVSALRSSANERQVDGVRKVKKAAFEARQDGPEGIRSHVTAAWKLMDEARYAEALEEVLKTPETHPHFYQSVALAGNIRRCLGDLEKSEEDLNRALRMSQRRPEAFLFRACLRMDQNRLDEGIEDAVRARELTKPSHGLAPYVDEILNLLHNRQRKLQESGKY